MAEKRKEEKYVAGPFLDTVFFIYFATHIPIAIFIDSQAVLPSWIYPKQCVELLQWFVEEHQDPVMGNCPLWLQAINFVEITLQLPFFFPAAYAFYKGKSWIVLPSIIYATHVATTMIPILGYLTLTDFTGKTPGPKTLAQLVPLLCIYGIYLVVPLVLLVTMLNKLGWVLPQEKHKVP